MLTYTGQRLNPWYPDKSKINILDIAHALSGVGRFGGHLRETYNVAHHSVLVSRLCKPENALWGLLHDAAEAYLGDMVSPIKRTLPDFIELERIMQRAICEKFNIPVEQPPDVKDADNIAYSIESWSFRRTTIADPDRRRYPVLTNSKIYPMDRIVSELTFLSRFNELTGREEKPLDSEQLEEVFMHNARL